jgi:hypothetical protein
MLFSSHSIPLPPFTFPRRITNCFPSLPFLFVIFSVFHFLCSIAYSQPKISAFCLIIYLYSFLLNIPPPSSQLLYKGPGNQSKQKRNAKAFCVLNMRKLEVAFPPIHNCPSCSRNGWKQLVGRHGPQTDTSFQPIAVITLKAYSIGFDVTPMPVCLSVRHASGLCKN